MRAFVRLPESGYVMTVSVEEKDTIKSLKGAIERSKQTSMPALEMQLFFFERELQVCDSHIFMRLVENIALE
jgi:hypothetical protein